jgi:hypothetical protein
MSFNTAASLAQHCHCHTMQPPLPNWFRRKSASVLMSILPLLGLLTGCGDKNWGTVTGTVTLKGAPVGPGSLMFEPANPESITAPSAIGHFREDGKYALKSAGNREGAPTGEYFVMIHGRGEESFGDELIDPKHKSAIPAKYLNHRASGLKATVKPGENTIDFDLSP